MPRRRASCASACGACRAWSGCCRRSTGLPPAYLVGGAVRDLLRGGEPLDIDIAVEGDARSAARALAERLGGEAREYERFGTATVRRRGSTFDLATTRRETYDEPGALPRGEQASLAEDLRRRDFTVNAMAVGPHGRRPRSSLRPPRRARRPRTRGVIRVLHERSFLDDPTRLLRAVRYATRLGFALDPETERLAREAVAGRALSTVSGARIRDELMDLLRETDAPAAVERMRDLEIHTALHPELDPDPELVASAALGAVAIGADRGRRARSPRWSRARPRSSTCGSPTCTCRADERDAASRAARVAPRASRRRCASASTRRPSCARCWRASRSRRSRWRSRCGAPSEPILRWVSDLRDVGLEISGADLLAAGVPEGPAVGRALEETLRRKLDGLVSGREEELETALAARRGARAVGLPGARVIFTTRQGGVSEGPYESLNLGDPHRRRARARLENRRRAAARPGWTPSGWRWAGRCTAPTCRDWTGPPAGPGLRAARAARTSRASTATSPREPGSGCSCWWRTATRSRSRTASRWRCSTAAGAPLAGGHHREGASSASSGRRRRRWDRVSAAAATRWATEVLEAFADVDGVASRAHARPARGDRGASSRRRA